MFKRISLRLRLTLLTSLLIAICCIGLSIVLSDSAYRMADTIGASVVGPAQSIGGLPTAPSFTQMTPIASTQTITEAKRGYHMESLLYTIVAVITGGFFTYYISGKALNPVRALNSQVKNINAYNLDESLEIPPSKDELSELTASFNDMTNKLAQVFEAQKRFSADAAHELRTPLAVLQTKLDVFSKKEEHTAEEYQTLIHSFQKQVHRMRNLVAELLDIANMEHELLLEPVSLIELFRDLSEEFSLLAENKRVTFFSRLDDMSITGDYEMLYRAFFNLIENAIKYNVPSGSVSIEVFSSQDSLAVITVKDTGIGISKEHMAHIFEPFYRVDKSRSRKMGGAGLGLSLVETIIKKHNGTITVSENKGGGTCFTVTLPIS